LKAVENYKGYPIYSRGEAGFQCIIGSKGATTNLYAPTMRSMKCKITGFINKYLKRIIFKKGEVIGSVIENRAIVKGANFECYDHVGRKCGQEWNLIRAIKLVKKTYQRKDLKFNEIF
jgi:hypothetical protein